MAAFFSTNQQVSVLVHWTLITCTLFSFPTFKIQTKLSERRVQNTGQHYLVHFFYTQIRAWSGLPLKYDTWNIFLALLWGFCRNPLWCIWQNFYALPQRKCEGVTAMMIYLHMYFNAEKSSTCCSEISYFSLMLFMTVAWQLINASPPVMISGWCLCRSSIWYWSDWCPCQSGSRATDGLPFEAVWIKLNRTKQCWNKVSTT